MRVLYYTWDFNKNDKYYIGMKNLNFIIDSTDDHKVVIRRIENNLIDILLIDTTTVLNYKKIFDEFPKLGSNIPIIAIGNITDPFITNYAFNYGLTDYILNTLNDKQVSAKITGIYNMIKKTSKKEAMKLSVKDLELDIALRQAIRQGVVIPLRNKEYQILELLLRNKNKIVSRELISETIWNKSEKYIYNNTGDVHIAELRKKLEEPFYGRKLITSVRGVGYMIKD